MGRMTKLMARMRPVGVHIGVLGIAVVCTLGTPAQPEGRSLLPAFQGREIEGRGMLFWEHEGNCAIRDGKWKLVSRFPNNWELYDMEADRTETNDIADDNPEQMRRMLDAFQAWATRVGVQPWPMPGTPHGEASGQLPLPEYLRVDRPAGRALAEPS